MVFLPLCAMLLMVIVDRTLTERGAHWLSLEEPWDEPFYVAALAGVVSCPNGLARARRCGPCPLQALACFTSKPCCLCS